MNKILTIAAASTLSLSISSVLSAGDIEKAERYSAPLEQQTVVERDVCVVETGQVIETSKELGLGSNVEVEALGHSLRGAKKSNAEVEALGLHSRRMYPGSNAEVEALGHSRRMTPNSNAEVEALGHSRRSTSKAVPEVHRCSGFL